VDRPSYRPEAAAEGWRLIWEFFGRHLDGQTMSGGKVV
jgi:carboxymethylenebutenolidase